ncbi:MAG TPA: MarR family transcriptional regulator [Polyangiaceae bacterium]|jgi:DNA-binding MarR family transcriptional regulator|nr:MarR family transcriptional regulator [Polyangiaceae bacterium]
MPHDTDDPTLTFLRAVWDLDHRLQSQSKRMKQSTGVTGPQRFVLKMVLLSPDTTASEIARKLFFHKSTVTVILRSLEKAKLVARTPSTSDKRAVVLALTAKGRKIAEQRAGTVEARVRKALSRLPARDVDIARRVIEAVAGEMTT